MPVGDQEAPRGKAISNLLNRAAVWLKDPTKRLQSRSSAKSADASRKSGQNPELMKATAGFGEAGRLQQDDATLPGSQNVTDQPRTSGPAESNTADKPSGLHLHQDGAQHAAPQLDVLADNAEARADPRVPETPEEVADAPAPPQAQEHKLWEQAYKAVEESKGFEGYVVKYEKILLQQDSSKEALPPLPDRQEQMVAIIDTQRQRLKNSQWGLMISGHKLNAADLVENIVKGIIYAKGAVESIVRGSGEPHAAMAWAGVCILLPLVTNPTTQKKDAIKLLEMITDRMNRYHVIEETFSSPAGSKEGSAKVVELRAKFEMKTVALYAEILKAQILLACTYARSSFLQYGRDVIKWDNWVSMQQEIVKKEDDIKADISALDQARSLRMHEMLEEITTEQNKIIQMFYAQAQYDQDKQNSKLLQCFKSKLDYRGTKAQVALRVPGTFDWIATDGRFTSWRDTQTSEVLFVSAGAGCGKSVLLRHLLDEEIQTSYRRLTCYFFFRRGPPLQQSALECINAILHQMFQQAPDMIDLARAVYKTNGKNMRTQFEDLCDLLRACLTRFEGEVIWVIDGLDECYTLETLPDIPQLSSDQPSDEENRISDRNRFFDQLASLIDTPDCCLKLLLSARAGFSAALEAFKDTPKKFVDVTADEVRIRDDLLRFIDAKVQALELHLETKRDLIPLLQTLQNKSRTYLWLDLIFKLLEKPEYRQRPFQDLKVLVQGSLKSVEETFKKLLPADEDENVAEAIFLIVLGARRTLTVFELKAAVQAATGMTLSLEYPGVLAVYCGAFIEVSTVRDVTIEKTVYGEDKTCVEEKKTVNFFHEEARRFLIRSVDIPKTTERFYHAFDANTASSFMLTTCVSYLKDEGSKNTVANLNHMYDHKGVVRWISTYLKDKPFLSYAAIQWINHLPFETKDRQEIENVTRQIQQLCDVSSSIYSTWFVCCWRMWSPDMDMLQFFKIYTAAFIGDHLHPDAKLKSAFDLSDPMENAADIWWYWTASGSLEPFKELAEKCKVSYQKELPYYVDLGATIP